MQCKKTQYRSYEKANLSAIRIEIENGENYPKLKPYKCKNCGKFHLSSNSNLNKIGKQNLHNETEFIRNESDHWNAYFKNL